MGQDLHQDHLLARFPIYDYSVVPNNAPIVSLVLRLLNTTRVYSSSWWQFPDMLHQYLARHSQYKLLYTIFYNIGVNEEIVPQTKENLYCAF